MFAKACRTGGGILFVFFLVLLSRVECARAEVSLWQLGGSGVEWAGSDTTRVMIQVEEGNAIRPIFFSAEENVFGALSDWSEYKIPRELGFIDGHRPRLWSGDGVGTNSSNDNTLYVDGDPNTYNATGSSYDIEYTLTVDLGVPVPSEQFSFTTPEKGYRADGLPLAEDAIPAYEVTLAPEANVSVYEGGYHRLDNLIGDVMENFASQVDLFFPRQYVRFIRFRRKASALDEVGFITEDTWGGTARRGTLGEFVLYGAGAPRRAIYVTRIIDLGESVNFGRLFWRITPLRVVDGQEVVDPTADVGLRVEMRTGRDGDPNVYHEFTEKGKEVVVSRQRYENELQPPAIMWDGEVQSGKPGLQASITYDTENWSYWSTPITESGQAVGLPNGSHLQLTITLESDAFDAFTRLDSIWIERSPLLARQVVGEIARVEEPQPARGVAEVELGEMTEFTFDLKASFAGGGRGFDGIRIRTDSRPEFRRLEMGEPVVAVEPERVELGDEGATIWLPERVTAGTNAPIRLVLAGQFYTFATTLRGEVFDSNTDNLPQPIEAGDATERVSTNSLRILGVGGRAPDFIQDLRFSTRIVTPNGDGINDELEVEYTLYRLPEAIPVRLSVYTLAGAKMATVEPPDQRSGVHRIRWDGRDGDGVLLPPGSYLVDLELKAEFGDFGKVFPVGVAY